MTRTLQLVIAVACVLFFAAVAGMVYTISQNQDLAETTRNNLIVTCEKNREPLSEFFKGERASAEATDPALFPDIPPETFKQLLAVRVQRLNAVIAVFDPEKCKEQY